MGNNIKDNHLIRNSAEVALLRKSGQITAMALKKTIEEAKVGVSLLELDKIAETEILRLGGKSSFKSVPGYFWTTCLTVNEEVVHGIPRDIILNEGDVLNIDLGAEYQGWHTDSAWTVIVQSSKLKVKNDKEKDKFLEVGERVLWETLKKAKEGNRIGDISSTIEQGIKGAGYNVVRSLSGHGIGRKAHEDPVIPEYGVAGTGMLLRAGMSIAIEVIYTNGSGKVYQKDDNWTIAASDGTLGGLFEMSVIVGKEKPEIITDWRK